jgi:probable addiction module antidote protein
LKLGLKGVMAIDRQLSMTLTSLPNMSQLARDTGMSRERLYKALSPERNSTLETVVKAVSALGFKLTIQLAD